MTYTPASMPENPGWEGTMSADILSSILAAVRLTGALMFRVDLRGPWGVAANPTVEKFAPLLPAGTNHIIAFHVVLEGRCWIRQGKSGWIAAEPGEAVVMAHGGEHDLCDAPDRMTVPLATMLGGQSPLQLRHARLDIGPGEPASLLCGFLGCDRRAFEPLLHSLPQTFKVTLGESLGALVHYAVTDALDDRPGAKSLRARMAELLFTETLRLHMDNLPVDATGWLAGLRDPLVGRALRALHAAPCRHWTVEELAAATGSSRSSLATRFREMIGEPPMHYLTRLRMQLAARQLTERSCSLASLAGELGYDSAAAFQRAFKRCFGTPPAAWRRNARVQA